MLKKLKNQHLLPLQQAVTTTVNFNAAPCNINLSHYK